MAHLPKGQGVFLPPFQAWLANNIPAVYDNTLSYYEELCALIKYLQDIVVPAVNENASALTTISEAVEQLQKYVDTYFDNLDVQEEINNKLDEMAEDGTLERIIGEYIDEKVYYIFPKDWSNGTIQSGDCGLIKAYGKNILIDTGYPEYESNVEQFLDDEGVEHIDYLFLSHYHTDHAGNVTALLNDGYIDSTTIFYLPPLCNLIQSDNDQLTRYNEVHTLASNNNITVITPTEGSYLELHEGFRIYCYNVDVAVLNAYDTTDSNNASMVNLVEHGGKKALYAGDAGKIVLDKLVNDEVLDFSVDFYKVEHHGFNWIAEANPKTFISRFYPTYAYFPANTIAFKDNNLSASFTGSFLKNLNTKLYAQYLNLNDLKFVSTPTTFDVLDGIAIPSVSNMPLYYDIYVDPSSLQTKMDGSENYPYKDLLQAIANIRSKYERVTIHLADGTYNTSHPTNNAKSIPRFDNLDVTILGNSSHPENVIITNGFNATNSRVVVKNCTIDCDANRKCVELIASNTVFSKVYFTCSVVDKNNNLYAISSEQSKIVITDNSSITGYTTAIGSNADDIHLQSITFSSCTNGITMYNTILNLGAFTFTNVTTRWNKSRSNIVNMNPVVLATANGTSGTLSLNDEITAYNEMIVQTWGSSGLYTDIIMSYAGNNFELNKTYKAKGLDNICSIVVDSTDPKKVTFTSDDALRRIYGVYKLKE